MSNDDKQYSIAIFPRASVPSWENHLPTLDSDTHFHSASGDLGLFSGSESKVDASTSCFTSSSPDSNAISNKEDKATIAWQERQNPVTKFRKRSRSLDMKFIRSGLLILELRIPTALMNTVQAKYREYGEEFTHARCKQINMLHWSETNI